MNHNCEKMTRLIDGELTDLERSHFLTSLDEEGSEHWRTLALGLLERQLMTDALKKLKTQTGEVARPTSQNKTKKPWFGDWVAQAALLVAGLVLGFSGPRLFGEKRLETAEVDAPEMFTGDGNSEPVGSLSLREEERVRAPIRGGYITANFGNGNQLIVPISHVMAQNQ